MFPRVGSEFAGYRIVSPIGRGGMSVVYRAEHLRLSRNVALKMLLPELSADDTIRERFLRESRIAGSMDHPNVVPIYDAGEFEGVLYISMRYVPDTLRALLRRVWRLEPPRAVSILSQVGNACDAAHAAGLVHRDIKPANVLIASSGTADMEHAYLSDFGLAKNTTSRSGLTGTGQFVGTIDYMAPEQIEGAKVDGRVDVYALGCMLYECLSGAVPFQRDDRVALMYAHLRDEAPSLATYRAELPEAVDAVVRKAMAKSPDNRYETCGELMAAASAAVHGSGPSFARGKVTQETVIRKRPDLGDARSAGNRQA